MLPRPRHSLRVDPRRIAATVRAVGSGRVRRRWCRRRTSDFATRSSNRSMTSSRSTRSPSAQMCLRCCEVESAGEHRHPGEHGPFGFAEGFVGPVDRCFQGAVPFDGSASATQAPGTSRRGVSSISFGCSDRVRLAASSMASGIPSSREQIRPMVFSSSSVHLRRGTISPARRTNNATPA